MDCVHFQFQLIKMKLFRLCLSTAKVVRIVSFCSLGWYFELWIWYWYPNSNGQLQWILVVFLCKCIDGLLSIFRKSQESESGTAESDTKDFTPRSKRVRLVCSQMCCYSIKGSSLLRIYFLPGGKRSKF